MNKTISLVVGFVVVAGACFYGGYAYAKNKLSGTQGDRGNFVNLTPDQRQARFQNTGAFGTQGQRGGQAVAGEVIGKDDKSLTVKLPDGGSKLVFFSASTTVDKTSRGALGDLNNGVFVVVGGTDNSDGTVTAQTIQIRPEGQIFREMVTSTVR